MEENKLIIYKNKDGNISVDAIYKDETLWLSQKGMSKVFDVNIPAISKHLNNIFSDEELEERMVVSKMENTTIHGAIEGKTQTSQINMYN
ncbi:MAG: cell filamentation protein Fic, partial [Clostridia bacterium]